MGKDIILPFYIRKKMESAEHMQKAVWREKSQTPVVLSDSPEPKDNQYYAWIQDLVSSRRTNSELAEELRCGFVAGTDDLSLV